MLRGTAMEANGDTDMSGWPVLNRFLLCLQSAYQCSCANSLCCLTHLVLMLS